MSYLIQKNVFHDARYDEIFEVLKALKLEYEVVPFKPNSSVLNFTTTRKDAYVMDIALTFEGWKIVEVNCINSAGFYKADIYKIIESLEAFYS